MKSFFRLGAFVFLAAVAQAQTASQDGATLEKLLEEVRLLRINLEKTATLGPLMQLILQRTQLQDARVARISQQLDEVHKQVAAETAQQADATERLAKIEQDISSETDAGRRAQLEDVRAHFKTIAGRGPGQQLRARESELANSLQGEQATLSELNEKLDALERQLEAPPAADAQTPKAR
jgi:chromosome segregation ATPase